MPKPSKTKQDYRNKELAKIHILKKQIGIDDDTYRQMLMKLTGKDSAAKLSVRERWDVINYLSGDTKVIGYTTKQRRKVWRLCNELHINDSHLRTFCKRQIGKPRPETIEEGTKLITGLLALIRDRKK